MKNLLVELFVEELPPKALKKLGESFAKSLFGALKERDLLVATSAVTSYASPRRLAAHITSVAGTAPDKEILEKLLPVSIAIGADGKPTDTMRKRLAKIGREAMADLWPNAVDGSDRLFVQSDGKADAVFLRSMAKGASLQVGLEFAIEEALRALPIPKVMTYQLADGWSSVNFVRPAHKLVALHGADVVPISVLGLNAGRETQGHRFEAKNLVVSIKDADSYAEQLKTEGAVIASFAERRAEIESQLRRNATQEGLKPIEDEALLDEVTALVERPNVLTCQFEQEFLDVPQECLILTMKANQKYFPLLDAAGKLTNKFLVVSNISPADASAVIGGNERVVRPRLADAKFFFDQDRKKSLADRIPGLAKVVYHNKLGTQGERAQRVAAIASAIGKQLGGEKLAQQADQAALLSKADLLTDMVGEFPELQGIMGRYYALHDGLPVDIADAIEDHYKPRFAGDTLPRGQVGVCVALADKLETLAGMFGIGQLPTGDKDPFALRRHALGVIRMLIEQDLPLDIDALIESAILVADSEDIQRAWSQTMYEQAEADAKRRAGGGAYMVSVGYSKRQIDSNTLQLVSDFIYERLAGSLREQGYSALEVDAVVGLRPQRLGDIPKRLAAVREFLKLPEASSLAAANKRVGNILKKVEGEIAPGVDKDLLVQRGHPAEQALASTLAYVIGVAGPAFERGDYTASLQALARLKVPVDKFFDDVMVNTDDSALRANRLGLLAQLRQEMNRIADISRLSA